MTAAELERARRSLEVKRIASVESLSDRADTIATWLAIHGDPDHLAEDLAALAAVTPASLQITAARWLADQASLTMVVMPEKPAAPTRAAPAGAAPAPAGPKSTSTSTPPPAPTTPTPAPAAGGAR